VSGIDSATLDKPSLVIGNGESRKGIDLKLLQEKFITVGCNALHRDFMSDHLVCFDRRMAEEVTNNPATKNSKIHVRKDWFHYFRKIKKNKNIVEVPPIPYTGITPDDDPLNWGSGSYAVVIGASLSDTVFLIGFDLYGKHNKLNNVYKGTTNYAKTESNAVDPAYWIRQIGKTMSRLYHKKFVIINEPEWSIPKEWKLQNVQFMIVSDFMSLVLNTESKLDTAVFHGIQPAL